MTTSNVTRRAVLGNGLRGLSVLALAQLPSSSLWGETDSGDGQVIPFLDDQPIDPKRPMLKWQDLTDWVTPNKGFFAVSHYGMQKLDGGAYRLNVEGLVEKPVELTLDQIMSRPKRDYVATLECSGNGASAKFMGAIGNAKWTGTSLAPLLKECGIKEGAIEAAFWGADSGKEKIRNAEYEQNFARALSIADATRDNVLLAWAMNDQPLAAEHGFPLRLIVPGWYGIAWVKWLTRIELRDRRLANRFMARDYVTIRGEKHGDAIEWKETSVGPMNVKSLVGRVVRKGDGSVRITGAAWGHDPIRSVELKIDDGAWMRVQIHANAATPHAWLFWSYDWKNPAAGEHTLVSRATDEAGRVQPTNDEDAIKLKKTYWEANQQYPRRIKL